MIHGQPTASKDCIDAANEWRHLASAKDSLYAQSHLDPMDENPYRAPQNQPLPRPGQKPLREWLMEWGLLLVFCAVIALAKFVVRFLQQAEAIRQTV
jgi:hypothetical protein